VLYLSVFEHSFRTCSCVVEEAGFVVTKERQMFVRFLVGLGSANTPGDSVASAHGVTYEC
jgi:hypothetical protein